MDVTGFYDNHPISEAQITSSLEARGLDLDALKPADLYDFDQDHYGGLEAVDTLAARTKIGAGSKVLDVCAGLAGPARYLAAEYGAEVTALELNQGRAAGAAHLAALVGLSGQVGVVRGDAAAPPFAAASFDACISQEALLHVPDKQAVLDGCRRVLKSGGWLSFTDWLALPGLSGGERAKLTDLFAAQTLQSPDEYRDKLKRAGFAGVQDEDLSPQWREILPERHRMFRSLKDDTVARLGLAEFERYDALYGFFVDLITAGRLGGGRFTATAA